MEKFLRRMENDVHAVYQDKDVNKAIDRLECVVVSVTAWKGTEGSDRDECRGYVQRVAAIRVYRFLEQGRRTTDSDTLML